MTIIFFQIIGREGLSVRGINHRWIQFDHLLPRLPVLLQVLNPDDGALDAGEAIHGGIATEQDAVLQHGNMVGRMSGSLYDLEG